jgi:hypothetical protein
MPCLHGWLPPDPASSVRLAGGVDRAADVVRLLAARTGVAADIAPLSVGADPAARAADTAVADFAREAIQIAATATIC